MHVQITLSEILKIECKFCAQHYHIYTILQLQTSINLINQRINACAHQHLHELEQS